MRIENTISLKDDMTPTLKSINTMMGRVIKVMDRLAKASNNVYMGSQVLKMKKEWDSVEAAVNDANKAVGRLSRTTAKAGNQATTSASKFRGFANAARSGYSTSLSNIAHGLYTAERLYNYGKAAFGGIDMMKSQKSLIRLSNDSQRPVNSIYDDVIGIALGTRSSLSATGDTVGRLLSSGALKNRPGGNMANALKYTEMLNKAMVSSGRSAEEIERAMVQLNQGLGQNILQGDELRSIREQVPYFAALLAEGISRKGGQYAGTTMADLKGLGASGTLTTDFILDALDRVQDKINKDYELTEKTFGQGITTLQTLWLKFLNSMSDAGKPFDRITKLVWNLVEYLQSEKGETFFDALAKILNEIITLVEIFAKITGNAIIFISDNIDIILPVLTIVVATIKTLNTYLAITKILEYSLLWPILAIITALTLVVMWVNKFKEAMEASGYTALDVGIMILQTISIIIGAVLTLVTVIISALIAAGSTIFSALSSAFLAFHSWVLKGFSTLCSAISNAVNWAIDKINILISKLNGAIAVVNFLTGLNIPEVKEIQHVDTFSNMANSASVLSKGLGLLGNKIWEGNKSFVGNTLFGKEGFATKPLSLAINGSEYLEQFKQGGRGVGGSVSENGFGNFHSIEGMYNTLDDIAGNTEDLAGPGGTNPSGGSLDSVKDVSLSDEDVRLLRDMSARDYLLKLQQITPMMNVSFGDVRETADVGRIMEVIETMAREQLASSMVTVG